MNYSLDSVKKPFLKISQNLQELNWKVSDLQLY